MAIGVAMLVTGVVLVWRWVYDSAPWSIAFPPWPAMRGWDAFNLYYRIGPVGSIAAVVMGLGLVVRWVTKRRGATAWIGVVLQLLVCLQTAALYALFWAATVRRTDRVAGVVEEPAVGMRAVALSVIVTMVLAAAFICVTRFRRTPRLVRQSALSVGAILAGLLLNLSWILCILPITNDWSPAEWRRPELLTSLRPCRGALLWQTSSRRSDDEWSYPVGRIDDIWLRFADPATPGRTVWAVSATGQWEEGYVWLRRADVAQLRVRRDDPAVIHCDSRPRPERVAPASWHRMGIP